MKKEIFNDGKNTGYLLSGEELLDAMKKRLERSKGFPVVFGPDMDAMKKADSRLPGFSDAIMKRVEIHKVLTGAAAEIINAIETMPGNPYGETDILLAATHMITELLAFLELPDGGNLFKASTLLSSLQVGELGKMNEAIDGLNSFMASTMPEGGHA